MRILYRILAIIGAMTLFLLAYSTARSPSGTGLTLLFISKWWIEPLVPAAKPNSNQNPEIVKNPRRDRVAGLPLSQQFALVYQNEETFEFNGDGHVILIAELSDGTKNIVELAKDTGMKLEKIEPGILGHIQFLKDTTPYSEKADQIEEILNDPQSVYFLLGLKRNGLDISDLDIFIFSPSTKKALQWSSHF